MTPSPPELQKLRALAARYLDPRATWTLADEDAARALREDPVARRAWALALATHRAMVGAEPGLPSGHEQRRQAAIAMARAGLSAPSSAPASRFAWLGASWFRLAAPLLAIGAAVLFVTLRPPATADEWIRARGLSRMEFPEPRVGLGVGGVTGDGREYEAVSSHEVHLDDWLRFSYTNERQDLGWLYLFAVQPGATGPGQPFGPSATGPGQPFGPSATGPGQPFGPSAGGLALRPIAPLPDEAQSLPIKVGHFVPLAFETRLAARHHEGPVRLVALFTASPIATEAVDKAIAMLDSPTATELPSDFEAHLRERLALSPGDVVHILDTAIVPGSADPPTPPGPRAVSPTATVPEQETP